MFSDVPASTSFRGGVLAVWLPAVWLRLQAGRAQIVPGDFWQQSQCAGADLGACWSI